MRKLILLIFTLILLSSFASAGSLYFNDTFDGNPRGSHTDSNIVGGIWAEGASTGWSIDNDMLNASGQRGSITTSTLSVKNYRYWCAQYNRTPTASSFFYIQISDIITLEYKFSNNDTVQIYESGGVVSCNQMTQISAGDYICRDTNSTYDVIWYHVANSTEKVICSNPNPRDDGHVTNDILLDSGPTNPAVLIDLMCFANDTQSCYNLTGGGAPPTPPATVNLTVYAYNNYTSQSLENFSVFFDNGTLLGSTTSGIFSTNETHNTTINITIFSDQEGGYFNFTLYNRDGNATINQSLNPYFYLFNSAYSNYVNFTSLNYTRSLHFEMNYTCADFSFTELIRYVNKSLNESINLTCNNATLTYSENYSFYTEGVFFISYTINTSYLPSFNNYDTNNQTFVSDLYNPIITLLNITFGDGFTQPKGNLSLTCTDTIFNPYYNMTFNNVQEFYNNLTSGTNKNIEVNITSGDNILYGRCSDLFGSANQTITETIYFRQIILIDEANNSVFDVTNLTSVIIYFDDNSTYFDFKTAGTYTVNFTSAATDKLRLELAYSNGDIITRYIDVSLDLGDLRLCANTDPTNHYEQLLVSAIEKPVSLKNVYSNCLVGEDYTRFIYQDSLILKAFTRDSQYYLYTYDDDGDKVYLASMDGSISSYYNIDILEFSQQAYNLDITGEALSFERYTNTTIKIFYYNFKNDSVSVNVTITEVNTSNVVFSVVETSNPNYFYLYFDFSTLGYDEKQVFRIELTTTDSEGNTRTLKRYFNLSGRTGYLPSGIIFTISILLTIFGLTMVATQKSLNWFGIIILLLSIALLSFGIITWYVLLMMAIDFIILVFIIILMATNKNMVGVT